jgi:hypothetical protein
VDVAAVTAVMTLVVVAGWNAVGDALAAFAAEIDFHEMAPPKAEPKNENRQKACQRIEVWRIR